MSTPTHITRIARRTAIAAVTVLTMLAALASPAAALDDGGDPAPPPDRADLKVTSLTVSPLDANWSISYTIKNAGTKSAPASTVAVSTTGNAVSRSVSSLAIGASRSGVWQVPRTAECSVKVAVTADSGKVVVESDEFNNRRETTSSLPGCPPRYRVSVYSFTAVDESGIDGSGSDEPFWTFNTVSTGGTALSTKTAVFGDVDTGESRFLSNMCIFGCSGVGGLAPLGIGVSAQLWEEDLGSVDKVYYDIASAFGKVGPLVDKDGWLGTATPIMSGAIKYILDWANNDLLGKNDFTYAPEYLAAALPSVHTSLTDTRVFGNSSTGARYSLVLFVQRTG